jgi:PleD family two-component response regulator
VFNRVKLKTPKLKEIIPSQRISLNSELIGFQVIPEERPKVLIVDDQEFNLKILSNLLQMSFKL